MSSEVERIKAAYQRRDAAARQHLYSPFNPSALFIAQQRERILLRLLKQHGFQQLEDKTILDVGCGAGEPLRRFLDYGAKPENVHGIDLLPDRIESARQQSPNIDFQVGNCEKLPFQDNSFDMVSQFTVFTSILDDNMKRQVAREMLRVLKPGGIIIWFDYLVNNPSNPDVRGVGRKEIHNLFVGGDITLKRVTLAPPLARRVAPISWMAALFLEKFPFLCSHYLGIIRKGDLSHG